MVLAGTETINVDLKSDFQLKQMRKASHFWYLQGLNL
jgi:hypothetical protein